ncbi:MAG: flagellin [Methylobacter tundripaludum]|uniref:Flagellin n=1 Tax=Methylobacter tundripaludum TaxID=173365 RepID=A0A2S6H319_9GAMM|nr:flagellin [Methylobacter tundripaludum]MCK9635720.1 flagellin [Methylobacter tundripaludum]PPK71806.1 flagellin [Methylobacter tundripaludum]
MAQYINTNMGALTAQRNLNKSQAAGMQAMQRLSSGLRINSAKDDSAGLSIVERMSAQIKGLNQAVRNANDGISIAQVAEGGLGEMSTILQRMRELAVQSANDSNSDTDRSSIQNEVKSLYDEIDRISATTDFNGVKLFSGAGANQSRNIQVGAYAGQGISFTIGQTDTKTLALNSSVAAGQTYSGRVGNTIAATGVGQMTLNGVSVGGVAGGSNSTNIAGMETAINNTSSTSGVTADAFNKVTGTRASVDAAHAVTGLVITVDSAAGTLGTSVTIDTAVSLSQLADNINRQVGGVDATIGKDGNLILSNQNGAAIAISGVTANTGLSAGTYTGFLGLTSGNGADIKIGTLATYDPSALTAFGLNMGTGNGSVTGDGQITASFATAAAATADLNSVVTTGAGVYDPATTSTDVVKINGVQVGATATGSAADKAAAINAIGSQTNVTATASTSAYVTVAGSTLGATNKFSINGTVVSLAATDVSLADVVTKINAAGIAGVKASADAVTGKLLLKSDSGVDIIVADDNGAGATGGGVFTAVSESATGALTTTIASAQFVGIRGHIDLASSNGGSIRIDGNGLPDDLGLLIPAGGTGLKKFGLVAQNNDDVVVGGGLDVSTASGATAAIKAIDAAINTVVAKRASMGAIQNRFTSVISNLQVSSENMTASRSRIQDTDFASETAELSRTQILQQAGTAMLAQANQSSQGVMALLR